MRLPALSLRGVSPSTLRLADRWAGEVSRALLVIAIGLALLNFLCIAQKFTDGLPVPVQAAAQTP